jgi:hypothetical protein
MKLVIAKVRPEKLKAVHEALKTHPGCLFSVSQVLAEAIHHDTDFKCA